MSRAGALARLTGTACAALFLTACAATITGAGAAQAGGSKVGVIDVPRLFEEFEGFKEQRKELETLRKDREKENEKRMMAFRKEVDEFQRGSKLLSEARQKEKMAELGKKQSDLQEWQANQSKDLQEREEGMVKRLEGDVRKALEKIGPDGDFSFVVRRDLFLYSSRDVQDLTDQVLSVLRAQAKDSAPKPKADKK